MTTVFVPRERGEGERRVATTPESVGGLTDAGLEVRVERGAGAAATIADDAFADAGADLVEEPTDGWSAADLVLTVGPPPLEHVRALREGAVLIGLLAAHRNLELVRTLAEARVSALAMELIPRITRAQRMDALSSQASIAGYRAAIVAAHTLDKHFPLSMTAAGTIRPATVVVLGAGVAGLQAIATARRLGAVVRANDIREAARAEVESLGGEFIDLEEEADAEEEGGYAKEVDEDFLTMQRRILGRHLADAHAVITTAFVPGKPAPVLVTEEMVDGMRPGSVLLDLAAAEGGNCELTPADGEVEHGSVRVIAAGDLASQMPGEASALYARNVAALVRDLLDDDGSGELEIDPDDEIVSAALLTADGEVVHGATAERLDEEEGER